MRDLGDLRQRQALPLEAKVYMTQARIREWYDHFDGNVCVSFSGGKDSTVLARLVRDLYPEVPLVFCNTGLEFPEIQKFAKKMGAEFVRPRMSFSEVISKYGYPIISKEVAWAIYCARKIVNSPGKEKNNKRYKRSELQGKILLKNGERSFFNKDKWLPLCRETRFLMSNKCCQIMKEKPMSDYRKEKGLYPYIGTLAEESQVREASWLKYGCNAFDHAEKRSRPLSFWREQDILQYIKQEGIEIASVYGEIVAYDDSGFEYQPMIGVDCRLRCSGCDRTGCIFCGFGIHMERTPRFQRLAKTHPRQYEYCMGGGQWVDNPDYDPAAPKMDGDWENWNPKKIWVPSKEGLGMKYVFDQCNQIYGKDFIRYE